MHSTISHSSSYFFNDTATTEIYTLSLHDALPIYRVVALVQDGLDVRMALRRRVETGAQVGARGEGAAGAGDHRSEEHTSELQSQSNLVCRLLLEKKKKKIINTRIIVS